MTTKTTGEHSKIINSVAKRLLKPAGMVQNGKSRTWIDDNGWFVTILEYQPSSYEKGTFLNIGINFNWYKKDYLSFDIGYREHEFIRFIDAESFEKLVIQITESALEKVNEYREIRNIEKAKTLILSAQYSSDELWGNYHRAMIHLMDNKIEEATPYMKIIIESRHEAPWAGKLRDHVRKLSEIQGDIESLNLFMAALIDESREMLKLPKWDR